MYRCSSKKQCGFSLIELLLLLTIAAVFFSVTYQYDTRKAERFKVDKVALEMQTVLNAGLLYYTKEGSWPNKVTSTCYVQPLDTTDGSDLSRLGSQAEYIPGRAMKTPFASTLVTGSEYYMHLATYYTNPTSGVCVNFPSGTFGVIAYFSNSADGEPKNKLYQQAVAIANKLPHGFVDSESKYIGAYVYPPGLDPDMATGLNFAGIYHHGACIPVPDCPKPPPNATYTYTPQVFVSPSSVSGVNDTDSTNVYPISSFTAYAQGPAINPIACEGGTTQKACTGTSGNYLFWRACVQIITERGDVSSTRTDDWGDDVSISAFTRCAISDEPVGTVFSGAAGVGYGN